MEAVGETFRIVLLVVFVQKMVLSDAQLGVVFRLLILVPERQTLFAQQAKFLALVVAVRWLSVSALLVLPVRQVIFAVLMVLVGPIVQIHSLFVILWVIMETLSVPIHCSIALATKLDFLVWQIMQIVHRVSLALLIVQFVASIVLALFQPKLAKRHLSFLLPRKLVPQIRTETTLPFALNPLLALLRFLWNVGMKHAVSLRKTAPLSY
jgi:hypothetical protein